MSYLLGSQKERGLDYLRGKKVTPTEYADLDIGIVFDRPPDHLYKVYGELYAELSKLFDPFDIDPIFLHETSILFQYEALNGYRIYADSEDFADEYEERITKFAQDLSFKRKLFERDFIKGLKGGYLEVKPK